MNIPSIKDIGNIKGKRIIVRLDLNVPMQDEKVIDDLRIKKSMATLQFLHDNGARTVIISHLEGKGATTLKPVAEYLKKYFPISFVEDFLNKDSADSAGNALSDGEMVLFENLRVSEGEKNNDPIFSAYLASFGDIYINDAFSVSHRPHASVVGVPKLLPHFAGFNLLEEITHIQKVFHPAHPFIFILGGAKFDTKLPLIEKFLNRGENNADTIFVGGALANNFYKEKGMEVGKSLVSPGDFNLKRYFDDKRVIVPSDVIVKNANEVSSKNAADMSPEDMIMDVGAGSVKELEPIIKNAKFVLWNGPMGNYEEGFKDQTIEIARIIIDSGVDAAVGGGDTTAAIASLGLENDSKIFVSTGGGAMLQYLLDETLVGIEALK